MMYSAAQLEYGNPPSAKTALPPRTAVPLLDDMNFGMVPNVVTTSTSVSDGTTFAERAGSYISAEGTLFHVELSLMTRDDGGPTDAQLQYVLQTDTLADWASTGLTLGFNFGPVAPNTRPVISAAGPGGPPTWYAEEACQQVYCVAFLELAGASARQVPGKLRLDFNTKAFTVYPTTNFARSSDWTLDRLWMDKAFSFAAWMPVLNPTISPSGGVLATSTTQPWVVATNAQDGATGVTGQGFFTIPDALVLTTPFDVASNSAAISSINVMMQDLQRSVANVINDTAQLASLVADLAEAQEGFFGANGIMKIFSGIFEASASAITGGAGTVLTAVALAEDATELVEDAMMGPTMTRIKQSASALAQGMARAGQLTGGVMPPPFAAAATQEAYANLNEYEKYKGDPGAMSQPMSIGSITYNALHKLRGGFSLAQGEQPTSLIGLGYPGVDYPTALDNHNVVPVSMAPTAPSDMTTYVPHAAAFDSPLGTTLGGVALFDETAAPPELIMTTRLYATLKDGSRRQLTLWPGSISAWLASSSNTFTSAAIGSETYIRGTLSYGDCLALDSSVAAAGEALFPADIDDGKTMPSVNVEPLAMSGNTTVADLHAYVGSLANQAGDKAAGLLDAALEGVGSDQSAEEALAAARDLVRSSASIKNTVVDAARDFRTVKDAFSSVTSVAGAVHVATSAPVVQTIKENVRRVSGTIKTVKQAYTTGKKVFNTAKKFFRAFRWS